MAQWKGTLTFGLVSITVNLRKAETSDRLSFSLIDRRDHSPVGYKLYNKNSLEDIPRSEVVKGYEYAEGKYVTLTNEDFKRANVKATQMIEIIRFVDHAAINPMFFERPYFIEPQKGAEKSYALLYEALKRSGRVGLATVVIQRNQHVAAVMVEGPVLVLELLRFAHELKQPEKSVVAATRSKVKAVNAAEIKMAEQLIDAMSGDFTPEEFRDTYQDDLKKFIQKKVRAGRTEKLKPAKEEKIPAPTPEVVDFVSLLKKSLKRQQPHRAGRGDRSTG